MPSRRNFLLAAAAAAPARPATQVWTLPEPQGFKTIDLVWLPMKDGTRIAMRLWLLEGAEDDFIVRGPGIVFASRQVQGSVWLLKLPD